MKRKYIKPKSRAIVLDLRALLSVSDVQMTSSDEDERFNELIIDKEGKHKADLNWNIF